VCRTPVQSVSAVLLVTSWLS